MVLEAWVKPRTNRGGLRESAPGSRSRESWGGPASPVSTVSQPGHGSENHSRRRWRRCLFSFPICPFSLLEIKAILTVFLIPVEYNLTKAMTLFSTPHRKSWTCLLHFSLTSSPFEYATSHSYYLYAILQLKNHSINKIHLNSQNGFLPKRKNFSDSESKT